MHSKTLGLIIASTDRKNWCHVFIRHRPSWTVTTKDIQ